ncbi:MAG: hypothetical protein H7A41_04875 [Chlamydiales bacterium]|nr:hypothetical protein [Chlamydiales bacterium]
MESSRLSPSSPELRSPPAHLMEEVDLQSDSLRLPPSALERRESQDLMAPERFSIIDTESVPADAAALAKVQGQLRPQGFLAKAIDTLWNRGIAAIFSSEQRKLNAARDLLAKPTEDLTKAMNHFSSLSNQVQRFGGAPITLENVQQYAAALKAGMVLVEVEDEEAPNGVRLEAQEPVLENEIQELRFARLSDGIRITDLEGLVAGVMTGKTPMTLLTAAKAVAVWRDAIQTAGKPLSDAEFRGLVTQANANVVDAGANRAFVESNTVTSWAQIDGMGQAKFISEAVAKFTEAVKGIDGEEHTGQAVRELHTKIEERAGKIAEITGGDAQAIKQALLNKLNAVPGFKETLMTAQDSLLKVVENNQSHAFLAREQMDEIGIRQQAIIDSEKNSFDGGIRKGEAAVVGTFAGLLHPETTRAALELHGRQEELEPGGKYEEVANHALASFGHLDAQMTALFTQGNAVKVAEGQARAQAALDKLDDLNTLISEANADEEVEEESERTWAVDTRATNKPIPEEAQTPAAVAGALEEELLTMIEGLAGQSDSEASPTLLAQLLHFITPAGVAAIDDSLVVEEEMFANETVDGTVVRREASLPIHGEERGPVDLGVTMLKFAGDRPFGEAADDRPIARLRGAIGAIRAEQAEVQRREEEAKMEAARLAREANPTIGMRIGRLFSRSQAPRVEASHVDRVESGLSLDSFDFAPQEPTRWQRFTAWASRLIRRSPQESVDPMSSTHQFRRLSSSDMGEEEDLLLGSGGFRPLHRESSDLGESVPVTLHAVGTPRPAVNTGTGFSLDREDGQFE